MKYGPRAGLLLAAATLAGCGLPVGMLQRSSAPASPSTAASPAAPAPATLAILPDDGLTSDVHRAYVGQIVFANAAIPATDADPTTFVAEIYADEPLYARAYLPHSLENVPVYERREPTRPLRTATRGFHYVLYVDGVRVSDALESRVVPRDRRTTTTLAVAPHPAPVDGPSPRGWVELINGLAPGKHVVRVELWANDRGRSARAPSATGALVVHKPAGVAIAVGRTFADLERGLTDAALARHLLGVARGFATKHRWKEAFDDIAIVNPAWIDVRHARLGHVILRRLQAWVRGAWPDGRCTAQWLVFEQRVKAGQPHGPIYVGSSGDQRLLDCQPVTASVVDRWAGRTRARPAPTAPLAPATAADGPAAPAPAVAPTAVTAPPTAPPAAPAPGAPATAPRAGAAPASAPRVASTSPASADARAPAPRVASTAPAIVPAPAPRVTSTAAPSPARRAQQFSLGAGIAGNARDANGVASYAHLGVHLGRLELGVGATWPLNVVGSLRLALVDGRFQIAPMVAVTALADDDAMGTTLAFAGGWSFALILRPGPVAVGLRLDALVSYDADAAAIAVPVLGSTYVRF